MITAVDSSVLIDVLVDDERFGESSVQALRRARREGQLVVCDLVVAEITPVVGESVENLMDDWHLEYVPLSREAALQAGVLFAAYLERGGRRGRVVADFVIGAHARHHADRLLCRDDGFQRDYFQGLEIWDPREEAGE